MTRRQRRGELLHFDPEIEVTCRHNNARRRLRLEEMKAAMNHQEKSIKDTFQPVATERGVLGPAIQANNFELKPGLIHMVQQNQFAGRQTEDPHAHLSHFEEICNTIKLNGVTNDAIRLRLFPFSLRDDARSWQYSLTTEEVESWKDMVQLFLTKYFPPSKIMKLRAAITQFQQFDQESFYEAWERYKEMLRKCPNHGVDPEQKVWWFYNGCNMTIKNLLDAAAGGDILDRDHTSALAIIEKMAANNHQWPSERSSTKKVALLTNDDPVSKLAAQISQLTSKIDALTIPSVQPTFEESVVEDVNYINNNRNFGNYRSNQGAYQGGNQRYPYQGNKNAYSNLSYGNPNNALQPPPNFNVTNGVINEEKEMDFEGRMTKYMVDNTKYMAESQTRLEKLESLVLQGLTSSNNRLDQIEPQMKMFQSRAIRIKKSNLQKIFHTNKNSTKTVSVTSNTSAPRSTYLLQPKA